MGYRAKRAKEKGRRLFFALFSFAFFILYSLLPADLAAAKESTEPIVVNGDRVEYLYEEKKVIGIDNVVITYKKVKLTCDKIVVQMDTKDAVAEGNVVMTQDEGVFRGQKVHYNFQTGKGTILKSEMRKEPWYFEGESASKVERKDYIVERGSLTTCDLPHPHYRIQARKIKIFLNNRVEAYHAFFFIGDVPIVYFPFYIHLLEDKRPRVTIVPGRNSRWGFYLLTAWRYYFHEWSRGYVHLDWREKKGFAEGIDYKYKVGYFGKGLARFYYTREDHTITTEEREIAQGVDDDRWRVQLRHKWQVDEDTIAIGEFHKQSDKLFIKDYFFLDEYETESQPPTYISVIRTRPKYNISLFMRARTHDFYTVVQRLPEVKLNVKSQRLRDTDFYYKSTTAFAMLEKKYQDTAFDPDRKASRFDTDHELSYFTKLFKFLTFNPYIGIRETWYSKDGRKQEDELRNIYTFGTKLSTKFYRIFPVETDIFGLNINKLRHIVTPSINYRFTPEPNINPGKLKQFDEVDRVKEKHGIEMSVVNRLQTKRGGEDDMYIENLARLTTSTELFIKHEDGKVLDDLELDLELTPYSWLLIDIDSTYSPKRNSLGRVNVGIVAEQEDQWRVGLGYRFEEGRLRGSNSQITTDLAYSISPKWKFKVYHRFKKDPDENGFELEEQNYAIERDLHCWLAEINCQVKKTDGLEVDTEYRVWLVMRIKAFPDIPFRMFSTRYSAPRAGVETTRSD